jgi:hypothetical protein
MAMTPQTFRGARGIRPLKKQRRLDFFDSLLAEARQELAEEQERGGESAN